MIFFLLLLVVVILIALYIKTHERFQGSAATISQINGSYVIQPVQGYNGPLKLNYLMSDSRTNGIQNTALLKVSCDSGRSPSPLTGLCT